MAGFSGINQKLTQVLVVDDEREICELVKDVLTEDGYGVETTQSGEDALVRLAQVPFEVVVTDVVMQGMDGLKLLHEVKSIRPQTSVILVTGYAKLDTAIQAVKGGASNFLLKPFSAEDIRSAVTSVLLKKRMEEEVARLQSLAALVEVGKRISATLDLEELAQLIVETACNETKAERGSLMLLDEERGMLTVEAAQGFSSEALDEIEERLGEGIAGRVAKTGSLLIINEGDQVEPWVAEAMRNPHLSCSLCLPITYQDRTLGVLNLSRETPGSAFTESDVNLASILCSQAAIAIENARLFEDVRFHRARVEKLLEQTLAAEEEERKRVAAEIHDGVIQWLFSALAQVRLCGQLLSTAEVEATKTELSRLESTLTQSVKEIRRVIAALRPLVLDEMGLVRALSQMVEEFKNDGETAGVFRSEGTPRQLPPSLELAIYRVIQEGLTNIRKHAEATQTQVRLCFRANDVLVEIIDDGKGFDLDRILREAPAGGHMGLLGIKKRVEALGGTFGVRTAPGAGTQITLSFPSLFKGKEEQHG